MCQGTFHGKITVTLFEWTLVFIQEVHIFNAYYSLFWERYNDVSSNKLGFTFSMVKHTHKEYAYLVPPCVQPILSVVGFYQPSLWLPMCPVWDFLFIVSGKWPQENYISSNVHVLMLIQKVLQLDVRAGREPLWVNSDSTKVALMTRVKGLCWLFPDCCLYQSHNWLKSPLHFNPSRQVIFNREWYGFMVSLCDWFHWVV